MRKILPILLIFIGVGGGVAAGLFLRPEPATMEEEGNPCGDASVMEKPGAAAEPEPPTDTEIVKLSNQFVVPVMRDGRVASLVVMSLSVEVATGMRERIYALEPKLRDILLQVLFDHANLGGFDGDFTASNRMDKLRVALVETARKELGQSVAAVLITDIARQDV